MARLWRSRLVISLVVIAMAAAAASFFNSVCARPDALLAVSRLVPTKPPMMGSTFGGCFNDRYPYVWNGGIRRHNESHYVVLALPSSNTTCLLRNVTCRFAHAVPFRVEVVSSFATSTFGSAKLEVAAVAWLMHSGVPYHDLFYPTGFFGRHSLLSEFSSAHGLLPSTAFRTIAYDGGHAHSTVVARHHYSGLFVGDFPSRSLADGAAFLSAGAMLLIHSRPIRRQFWSLPLLNDSIQLAQQNLLRYYGSPDNDTVSTERVFVEDRSFSHRTRHAQFRGYRPEVWGAITSMAKRNGLVLDKIDMKQLTFDQQLAALYQRKYMIVTEGSFSVWVPFLRAGTVCLMIYDHYGSGWMVPMVHLPVALLGDRKTKMVFVSIADQAVPHADMLGSVLLNDSEPQVTVVTVPENETLRAWLSVSQGQH